MPTTQQGYLFIADITGYTGYLSSSELSHAQETLTALLNVLIEYTRPPLIISRLAGDAVISYGLRDNFFQGQTFVELIEDTYVAFRRAVDLMVLNTTCQCNACKNIKTLDLKFFVHYGVFGIQKLDAHDELVGSDVVIIHRLLKNHVSEKTGIKAYTLYTDAVIQQLSLQEISSKMTSHTEEYEHLGMVRTWIQDMHPVWEEKKDNIRLPFPAEDIILKVSTDIELAPERVWDYLIQPEHFNVLAGGTRTVIDSRKSGRITTGSVYQCYHGDTVFPQTILEWQPFERILVQVVAPVPVKNTYLYIEYCLDPNSNGTFLTQSFSSAKGPRSGRIMANLMFKGMSRAAQRDIDAFGKHIEEVMSERDNIPQGKVITPEMVRAAAGESFEPGN